MGTDIHAHVEVKRHGVWLHYSAPHIARDYTLFTKLCGMREVPGVEPIAVPRGLPEDITEITKLDAEWWDNDGHTHSFITRDELRAVSNWYARERNPDETQGGHHGFEGVVGYLRGDPLHCLTDDAFEDVRMVFWFDC